MHSQRIIPLLLLILSFSCGKLPESNGETPGEELENKTETPSEKKDTIISLEHYNFYKSARVAQETTTTSKFNRAGSRLISETRSLLTHNDEGLKSLQETYTNGNLSLRISYTYGDYSMHQRTERPGDTPYEIEYTYEDAERTRVLEAYTTLPEATGSYEDYYQKTIYTWDNNRNTTQETYVYLPTYSSSEVLTQRVEKEYSLNGRVFGEITYTTNTGAFGRQASETFRSETTTYRDTSLRQPEKVVIYVNEQSVTTHVYTYNKDNLPVKREVYWDNNLYSFSAYTYKDNVRTVYTYMPLTMQVTETTYLDSHSYTTQEDMPSSPFETPSPQGEEDYSGASVSTSCTDWELTPIYLHNSLTGASSSFCFSLKNVSSQELTPVSNYRSRCTLTPIGYSGSFVNQGNLQVSTESVAPGSEAECSFKVGFTGSAIYETVNASVYFEYKAGTETRSANFYIQNLPVFDTLD